MATRKTAGKRGARKTTAKTGSKTAAKKTTRKGARKGARKATSAEAALLSAAGGREYRAKAAEGSAGKGALYRPESPAAMARAAAGGPAELMEPRPQTTTRYPISNEEFERLKAAAPKARLKGATAVSVRDARKARARTAAPLLPEAAGPEPSAAPASSTNFKGISATGWLPPDCTMAVGPNHVLASVNSSLAIYSKAGAALMQRTLTQWFANVVQGMTIFDPKALYDQHAGRWVVLAVAVNNATKASLHLLSVSSTGDPMGPWRNYRFDAKLNGSTNTNNWADFPAIGVDSRALYVTSNMFAFGGGFQYSKIRVIPKAGPYSGGTAPYFDFWGMRNGDNSIAFTIQPCHTYGAPQIEYLVNTAFPSGNYVTVWQIVFSGATPVLSRRHVQVSPYSLPPNANQKGGNAPLNTGDVRVLHAVFRGGSIWTAFTVAHRWGASLNRASIQWVQISAGAPSVVQQGVYGASTGHYFYPAIAPDGNGNVTMVFSRAGTNEFGTIAYTGRRATDPLGTLQGSAVLKAGVANYVALDSGGRNRWGDYNGVASDPANNRAVWFYSMYASAVNTWGTWVGSAFF